ncbi:MAG: hypothetical protein J6334_10790 [Kiritimatiellae bacterium]|nr:hypothetical protein [Kiritimatiellia bacterium]
MTSKAFFSSLLALFVSAGCAFAAFDFEKEWGQVTKALDEGKPRTATNSLARIESEARAAKRWPDATAAALMRVTVEGEVTEEPPDPDVTLAALTKRIDAAPAELQGVMQLYLAHIYDQQAKQQRWGGAKPTRLDDAAATNRPPWSAEKINETLEQQFEKVLAHGEELKRYPVQEWNRLFPATDMPDSYRPTLFDIAVHDIITFYGETLKDPAGTRGLALYDRLLDFHKKEKEGVAYVCAAYDRLIYQCETGELPPSEKNRRKEKALAAFIQEWGDRSEVAALAYHAYAELARATLGTNGNVVARERAIKGRDAWPKSLGGKRCAALIQTIEQPHFEIATEQVWCEPWPELTVSTRNMTNIWFKLIDLSFEELLEIRKHRYATYTYNDSPLKRLYSRKAVRTWNAPLRDPGDYTDHPTAFPVPDDLPAGHYLLLAALNDAFGSDDRPLHIHPVTVSPLALVHASGNNRIWGTVHLANEGTPVPDAEVQIWSPPNWNEKKAKRIQTARSGADGTFDLACTNQRPNIVRIVTKNGEAVSLNDLWAGGSYSPNTQYKHAEIHTDRAIYRPGQTLQMKGILFYANPAKKEFHTLPGEVATVSLRDPNNKLVEEQTVTANTWGSFSCRFILPRDRLTGNWVVSVEWGKKGSNRFTAESCYVRVEEYKRPKFSARFDNAQKEAVLGKAMTLTGSAETYSRLPIPHAKVAWHIKREVRFARWWLGGPADDDPTFAKGETETDAEGRFTITFTPQPKPDVEPEGEPSFRFTVTANVTDGTGESHAASHAFEVGTVAWRASAWIKERWLTPTNRAAANITVNTLNGAPIATKGELGIFALKAPPAPVREPAAANTYWSHPRTAGRKPELWRWASWETGEPVATLPIATATNGVWNGELPALPVGAYRMIFKTPDPSGKQVTCQCELLVFDPEAPRFTVPVPDFFELENYTVNVGGKIRLFWGSGYKTGYCRITLMQEGKTLFDEANDPVRPIRLLEWPVTGENRGTLFFRCLFVRENRLYTPMGQITVPWDNKTLTVTGEHINSKLLPGTQETWKLHVSAPAEVLALMYDRSLDAFASHSLSSTFPHHFTRYNYWMYPHNLALQNVYSAFWRSCGGLPAPTADSGRWRSWAPDIIHMKRPFGSFNATSYSAVRYLSTVGGVKRRRAEPQGALAKAKAPAPMAAAVAMDAAGGVELAEAEAVEAPAAGKPKQERKNALADKDADQPETIRRNLQETAFFLPDLVTDEKGIATFTFTVPDALTGWRFIALAHDNELRSGLFDTFDITTSKPLMAEPNPPRFAHEGDDFRFAVKVTNTGDEPQKGELSLTFTDAETDTPAPVGGGTQPFELKPNESRSFEFPVKIPDGQGFLKYQARAKGTRFTDGEEGYLPVLPRRVAVREAVQLNLRGAGTKAFALSNLTASAQSKTLRHADLTVQVVSRPAWYAVLALPYLMEYPHECCEQTFSRYYANALGSFIANADPRIRKTFETWEKAGAEALTSPLELNGDLKQIALDATPWLREATHETAARRRIGKLFNPENLKEEQARALNKLALNQDSTGLWPWFPGGPSSPSISLYILTGFARLNHLAGLEPPPCFATGVAALDHYVRDDVKRRQKPPLAPFSITGFDVRWLYLHTFKATPKGDDATRDFLIKHLIAEWTGLGLESQAFGAIVLNRMGHPDTAKAILASIKERGVLSEEMGMYWKRPSFFSCSLFAAPVSTQAAIIEAFLDVTHDTESVDACRVWMLKQKQTQNWSTTASTADAVYAILQGGGTDLLAGDTTATVTLGGTAVPVVNAEAGTGFYRYRYTPETIKPEMGAITFANTDPHGVAWGGVHWTYLEDVMQVRPFEPKELKIEKSYFRKRHTPEGTRLSPIEGVLEPGDELVARLVVTCDRILEYVHIQDERPACAEPEDVLSRYRWQDGIGYYQSTRDTATHYYIDRLPKGKFVLETSFRVQQRGTFIGGLATIQCMYAPEFTAHSTAETVTVK